MKNINKTVLLFIIFSFTQNTYTASTPAQAFSRANCSAPIPTQGYGQFSESISYDADIDISASVAEKDLILVKHNMTVTTFQTNNCNTDVRTHNISNPSGYRARAGYVDRMDSKVQWLVKGIHVEKLDNGSTITEQSSAIDCNLVVNQFV